MDASRTTGAVSARECARHGAFDSFLITTLPSGREIWTQCPACERERRVREDEEQREREAVERRRRLEEALKRAGIPRRFLSKTFDTYRAETAAQRHALQVARDFAGDFARHRVDGTHLVFSGLPGTGKSHLACAVAQSLSAQGFTALYATARELVAMLRESWGRRDGRTEAEVLRYLRTLDLLVVDEVGVGFGGDGERVQFFGVIDGRYAEQRPTVVLTNLDRDGLRGFIGQRAFDRLRDGGIWVPFAWESYRGRRGDANDDAGAP